MNPIRFLPAFMAACGLLLCPSARAADPAAPFVLSKQYSADMEITTKNGKTMTDKICMDGDKIRTQINMQGMAMTTILRPDLKKTYIIMDAQKMVMEMPYNEQKMRKQLPPLSSDDGKFELVGPDVVDGTACTKYKLTNKDNKVFFMWIDAAKQIPVKLTSEDGTMIVLWKNYVAGPQAASLFEPPTGYQTMTMPAGGGMPQTGQ